MIIDVFQIDAFTDALFGGNPAAVCPLSKWLPDNTLLNIAKENNLAETAYFVHEYDNIFQLRWFTPEQEIDLCGHATLASAFVILKYLNYNICSIIFKTMSGNLEVNQEGDFIEMNFPSRPPRKAELPKIIFDSLSIKPLEIYKSRDYVLIYNSEEDIKNLKVNSSKVAQLNLKFGGFAVTAQGTHVDFVSRFFTPGAAVFEDPVTGSAHCTLVPFWAERLKKTTFHALQISNRKGELFCKLQNDRVFIKGKAVTYLTGSIKI